MWAKIQKEIETVEKQTGKICPKALDLLQSSMGQFAEAFTYANEHQETIEQNLVRKGLISQNFNTLNAAIGLASSGFYLQSIGLLKNVYENWLAFWYLAKFPEDAH